MWAVLFLLAALLATSGFSLQFKRKGDIRSNYEQGPTVKRTKKVKTVQTIFCCRTKVNKVKRSADGNSWVEFSKCKEYHMTDDLEGLQKKNNCMIAGEDVSGRVFAKWEDVPQVQVYDDVYVNVFESLKEKNEKAFKEKQREGMRVKIPDTPVEEPLSTEKSPSVDIPMIGDVDVVEPDDQSEMSSSSAAGDLLGPIALTPKTESKPDDQSEGSMQDGALTGHVISTPSLTRLPSTKSDSVPPLPPSPTPSDPVDTEEPPPGPPPPSEPTKTEEEKHVPEPSTEPPVLPVADKLEPTPETNPTTEDEKANPEQFNYLSPSDWLKWWNTPAPPRPPGPARPTYSRSDSDSHDDPWGSDDDSDDDDDWPSSSPSHDSEDDSIGGDDSGDGGGDSGDDDKDHDSVNDENEGDDSGSDDDSEWQEIEDPFSGVTA
uniref:Uncharacterized protein n=1 Tax=Chromera velia CCMP2878 TaxID=1169474 RepID=A0A0G4FFL1_9ALVE|eukprot:Cvel_16724.t1-p1 / transcript=Cvel_16724.t1 / gene=Cvel_16724 / organism=Chromera_velia_CCMP2878 / gene_product=hypothetical protein / transcript_product=hypothetical protein / location=Cvel_scaffold1300:29505-30794(-) / protein_length=430 / sequence_SO=supercontig / SO=protein_coding / is_pseudo=false